MSDNSAVNFFKLQKAYFRDFLKLGKFAGDCKTNHTFFLDAEASQKRINLYFKDWVLTQNNDLFYFKARISSFWALYRQYCCFENGLGNSAPFKN